MSRIGSTIDSTRIRVFGNHARSARIRSDQRARLRDEPAEGAMQIELLRVLDRRVLVARAEDALAGEVDLQHDQQHVERVQRSAGSSVLPGEHRPWSRTSSDSTSQSAHRDRSSRLFATASAEFLAHDQERPARSRSRGTARSHASRARGRARSPARCRSASRAPRSARRARRGPCRGACRRSRAGGTPGRTCSSVNSKCPGASQRSVASAAERSRDAVVPPLPRRAEVAVDEADQPLLDERAEEAEALARHVTRQDLVDPRPRGVGPDLADLVAVREHFLPASARTSTPSSIVTGRRPRRGRTPSSKARRRARSRRTGRRRPPPGTRRRSLRPHTSARPDDSFA